MSKNVEEANQFFIQAIVIIIMVQTMQVYRPLYASVGPGEELGLGRHYSRPRPEILEAVTL